MEWQVVTTLVVLVGLIVTIVTPMIKLNTSIIKLTDAVQNLQVFQDLNKNKLEEHQEKIEDHEHRITVLEEHSNWLIFSQKGGKKFLFFPEYLTRIISIYLVFLYL